MKAFFFALLFVLAFASVDGAQGVTKFEGQIVCCEECWNRADRKTVAYGTPADLAKATECVGKGDPTLLAVMNKEGETTFYQLEEGKFKKPGKNWLDLIGSRVEISGTARSRKDKRFIR